MMPTIFHKRFWLCFFGRHEWEPCKNRYNRNDHWCFYCERYKDGKPK